MWWISEVLLTNCLCVQTLAEILCLQGLFWPVLEFAGCPGPLSHSLSPSLFLCCLSHAPHCSRGMCNVSTGLFARAADVAVWRLWLCSSSGYRWTEGGGLLLCLPNSCSQWNKKIPTLHSFAMFALFRVEVQKNQCIHLAETLFGSSTLSLLAHLHLFFKLKTVLSSLCTASESFASLLVQDWFFYFDVISLSNNDEYWNAILFHQ